MKAEVLSRKGARKVQDIPSNILKLLNQGKIETVNLTEWLGIDHKKLIASALTQIGINKEQVKLITKELKNLKNPTAMNSTKLVGALVHEFYEESKDHQKILKSLIAHESDAIRCYAPFLISLNKDLSIQDKLNDARQLIADKHFGVREVVWIALRPEIEKQLNKSIKIMTKWTKDKDENIRRFTTESTRPRGVWCKHIDQLKESPELALPILNPLKSDPSKYVQDSVGNWLNDASKTKADFVISICKKWQKESPTKETEKIIKRARRTIDKK